MWIMPCDGDMIWPHHAINHYIWSFLNPHFSFSSFTFTSFYGSIWNVFKGLWNPDFVVNIIRTDAVIPLSSECLHLVKFRSIQMCLSQSCSVWSDSHREVQQSRTSLTGICKPLNQHSTCCYIILDSPVASVYLTISTEMSHPIKHERGGWKHESVINYNYFSNVSRPLTHNSK